MYQITPRSINTRSANTVSTSLKSESSSPVNEAYNPNGKNALESEIKNLISDMSVLTEGEIIAKLSEKKRKLPPSNRPVDMASTQKIRSLYDELMKLEEEGRSKINERLFLQETAEKITNETDRELERLKLLQDITNGGRENVIELENEATRLKLVLTELKDQEVLVQQSLHTKNDHIDELIAQLQAYKDLDEKHIDTRTALKIKKSECEDAKDEELSLTILEKRKLHLLSDISVDTSDSDISELESLKKVMHHRIQTKKERREINQRTILAHGYEIALLLHQLRHLGYALKPHFGPHSKKNSTNLSSKPNTARALSTLDKDITVPIGRLDAILNRVTAQRKELINKDNLLVIRDIAMEDMERRVDILSHAHHSAEIKAQHDLKGQAEEYAHMQQIMDQRQTMFEEASEKLRQQQEYLREKLDRLGILDDGQ